MLANGTVLPGNALVANGAGPVGVVYDSGTSQIFTANYDTNSVSVVSDRLDAPERIISVGSFPAALVYDNATGEIAVANYASDTVSIISDRTDAVVATVVVGSQPTAIACDQATGDLFVLNAGSGNVTQIGGSTHQTVGSIDVGPFPAGIAFDGRTGELFIADGLSKISIFLVNGTVVGTVGVGNGPDFVLWDNVTGNVYVANLGSYNVSVVSDSTDTVIASPPVGLVTVGLASDWRNQTLYAVNEYSNNVTVISETTDSVIANLGAGSEPNGAAYDSRKGQVFVANRLSDNLSVIDAATNLVVADAPVGSGPFGAAYDNRTGELFVADAVAGTVDVLAANLSTVLARIPVGGAPDAVVYDAATREVYAGNHDTNVSLSVISDATDSVIAQVSFVGRATSLAYANSTGDIYVADAYSGNLTVISAYNRSVVATIPVGGYPDAMAFDAGTGELFVGNGIGWTVTVVSSSSRAVVAHVPVGGGAAGLAYDPSTNQILVANSWSDNVSVISDRSDRVVGNVRVGYCPDAVSVDDLGSAYVANECSDNVTVIDPVLAVVVGSVPVGSAPNAVAFERAERSLAVTNLASGTVSLAPVANGTPPTYPVVFSEAGLPTGTPWSVALAGTQRGSSGSILRFLVPNGSYPFTVDPVTGYLASMVGGIVNVNGSGADFTVTFAAQPTNYPVRFTGSGLPVGIEFLVELNGTWNASSGASIVFWEPNGSFAFLVPAVGAYVPSPASGLVPIAGGAQSVEIQFALPAAVARFPVWFNETGLPNGSLWGVEIAEATLGSTSAGIVTDLPNGSYAVTFLGPPGFNGVAPYSAVHVAGAAQSVMVAFEPVAPPVPPLRASIEYSILSVSCAPDGVASQVVLLGANVTGGEGPYQINWSLPAGNASGALITTTVPGDVSDWVGVGVTDSAGTLVTDFVSLPAGGQPCSPLTRTPNTLVPTGAAEWGLAGAAFAVAVTGVAIFWWRRRGRRPPVPRSDL